MSQVHSQVKLRIYRTPLPAQVMVGRTIINCPLRCLLSFLCITAPTDTHSVLLHEWHELPTSGDIRQDRPATTRK